MFPLRLCGGKLLVAVTRERRYGPRRLRVNDDDDDDDDSDIWVGANVPGGNVQSRDAALVVVASL